MKMQILRSLGIVGFLFLLISRSGAGTSGSVISESESPRTWRIETASSVYQLGVASDGVVVPLYYGPKGRIEEVREPSLKVDPVIGSKIREVPFRGGFVEQTPGLEIVYSDATRDCELAYQSHAIEERDGYPDRKSVV